MEASLVVPLLLLLLLLSVGCAEVAAPTKRRALATPTASLWAIGSVRLRDSLPIGLPRGKGKMGGLEVEIPSDLELRCPNPGPPTSQQG